MPKVAAKVPTFTTSNVGHKSPWTKAQQDIIDASLPEWYEFSIVTHGDKEGRDSALTNWKKKEAVKILSLSAFKPLPANVSSHILTLHSSIKQQAY